MELYELTVHELMDKLNKKEITYYENENYANQILKESWKYLTFQISECTEEALNKKCNFILKCQNIDWKPLMLEYHENVRVYTKYFYIEK